MRGPAGGPPGPVVALVGPTGVGKTAVAVALAGLWPIEVVSVDSRQVYRGLDAGTGKPTLAEQAAVRHHLVDVAEPDETYDAARFVREAEEALAGIQARGRRPVLVGGTGLYYRALVRGLQPRPPADAALRARLRATARAEGPRALFERLRALDAVAAGRLHPHDTVRVTRALEVAAKPAGGGAGGPTLGPAGADARSWRHAPARFPVRCFGLTTDRDRLYRRLDARVDRMLAAGLLEEVAALLARGIAHDRPALQGIGYRHLVPVVRGQARLADAVAAMKRDTRRYAKRQWTWFAREEGVEWLDVSGQDAEAVAARIDKSIDPARWFDYPG